MGIALKVALDPNDKRARYVARGGHDALCHQRGGFPSGSASTEAWEADTSLPKPPQAA